MADQRAASFTKRSIKTSMKAQGLRLALSMVDLTTLEGKDSPQKVAALCQKAIKPYENDASLSLPVPHVAALCVYPSMVASARPLLDGTGVQLASVATGFPSGQYPLAVRLRDCQQAIDDGADEIDMVISRGAFLSGRYDEVGEEILRVSELCRSCSKHLKVILETGELETYDNVRKASDLAIQAMHESGLTDEPGAGFIKTSTGKVSPAATMGVTLVMLEAIRDHHRKTGQLVGMKPAGGIRTAKQSLHFLIMVLETLGTADGQCPWLSPHLFRFGASSLANDLLRQIVKRETGVYTADYDFSEA